MDVQLDNLCTGLPRQCRRTHVIERLASVSRKYLLYLRSSMPPQRQRHRLNTEELARAMGMLECGSSQRRVDNVQQETIVRMEWPARSADLNPIEHV